MARALVRLGWQIPGWALTAGVAEQYALGLHYGYPLCCVEAFCRDAAEGRSPGYVPCHAAGLGYVSCGACREAQHGPQRPADAPVPGWMGKTPDGEGGA
jgi:hypothetical protein